MTTLETDSRAVVRFYNKFFMAPCGGTTANEKCLAAANCDATAAWRSEVDPRLVLRARQQV